MTLEPSRPAGFRLGAAGCMCLLLLLVSTLCLRSRPESEGDATESTPSGTATGDSLRTRPQEAAGNAATPTGGVLVSDAVRETVAPATQVGVGAETSAEMKARGQEADGKESGATTNPTSGNGNGIAGTSPAAGAVMEVSAAGDTSKVLSSQEEGMLAGETSAEPVPDDHEASVALSIVQPDRGGEKSAPEMVPEKMRQSPVKGEPRGASVPSPGNGSAQDPNGKQYCRLSVAPVSPDLNVGQNVTVELLADTPVGAVDVPLRLTYDSTLLQFLDASSGDFLKQDGGNVVFLANGHSRPGEVSIGIGRTDRSRGIKGKGTLCRVRFVGLAPGIASIRIQDAMAWTDRGDRLPVLFESAEVVIRPKEPLHPGD